MPEKALCKSAKAFLLRALGHTRGSSEPRYEWSEPPLCHYEHEVYGMLSLKHVRLPERGPRDAYHVQWL